MATVLIVDDDPAILDGLAETVTDLGHGTRLARSGREALQVLHTDEIDGVLLDLRMPGGIDGIEVLRRVRAEGGAPPVVVLTAFASAENTIEAMRLGAFDHLTKPIGREDLKHLLARLPPRWRAPAVAGEPEGDTGVLVGSSEAMRQVQKMIGLAADSDATVLVLGETGTGKELVARALHAFGRRKNKPFMAVNCAALPADLLESELFGHLKGSFTGATADRAGAFREAAGGTLFLDEIGDMPAAMQAKILRALQEKVVTPVGGKPCEVNVRVIAATHRDLPSLVASGAFRADLYYRLNVIPIALPPLRARAADILPLAKHFLATAARPATAKQLTTAAFEALVGYAWPGNVRELRNILERAHVLVRNGVIDAGDLGIPSRESEPLVEGSVSDDMPKAVAKLEKAMILRVLEDCGGNRAEAARRLNIHRQLLYTKMQRYGMSEVSEIPTSSVAKTDG